MALTAEVACSGLGADLPLPAVVAPAALLDLACDEAVPFSWTLGSADWPWPLSHPSALSLHFLAGYRILALHFSVGRILRPFVV